MSKGIDISKWNGAINFAQVKAGGVDFAILRAGYGKELSQKDVWFERYYAGCKQNSIPVGCYHYSYAKSMAELQRELDCFLQWIAGKTFEYPVYFDWEENYIPDDYALWFCDQLEQHGYFAGVYANTNFMANKTSGGKLDRFTLWLADYRQNFNKTIPRDIHQYTSTGRIAGISGNVDVNTCTRDFEAEIKAAGLNGFAKSGESTPKPTPAPTPVPSNGSKHNNQGQRGANPELKFSGEYDAKVAELQQLLGVTADGVADYALYNNLVAGNYAVKLDDKDWFVRWVQERLNDNGYDCGTPDGHAEAATMQGIATFQRAYALGEGYLGGTDLYYLIEM